MKVPISWLKEFISTKLSNEEIVDQLTMVGLEVEGIESDVMEIALTPNLAHCASMRGVARELAAITQEELHLPNIAVKAAAEADSSIQDSVSVSVENKIACPRYACRLIVDVAVKESPLWLKERIENCGMRSVNNVVDITNFVLLEYGHPLHAFDFAHLEGKQIIVRNAKIGEKIVTLDGKEQDVDENILLICDQKKPVAIAGIMGSSQTEVSEKTTSVFLESAYFEPASIRRGCKHLGIRSEASHRFERGTDPNGVMEALDRATTLICEIARGKTLKGTIDIKSQDFQKISVTCRLSRVNQILGTHLAMGEVETIFARLGFMVTKEDSDKITVAIPTYRHDVRQEIDLIEEVARLYGYGNLQKKEKGYFRTGNLTHSPEYIFSTRVRNLMIAEGLQEFLTCDLISPAQVALFSTDNFPSRIWIKLLNPHSIEQSIMRPSMLPGLLNILKHNADHEMHSVAGFEVGRVHFASLERYVEPSVVSIILTGERSYGNWFQKGEKVDFFDLKGILEDFFDALKITSFDFELSHFSNFHPGRQAAIKIDTFEVGIMGEIHPTTLKATGLDHPAFYAELNLEDLQRFIPTTIKMKPLPQFPSSVRDWTVTLHDSISIGTIYKEIEKERSPLLESYFLIGDIYKSDKLGSDKKNVTVRFIYRDHSKTISLAAVENEHRRIIENISEHLQRKIL